MKLRAARVPFACRGQEAPPPSVLTGTKTLIVVPPEGRGPMRMSRTSPMISGQP